MTAEPSSSVDITAQIDAAMRSVLHSLEQNLGVGGAVTRVTLSATTLDRLRAIRARLHPGADWLRFGGAMQCCPCTPCWVERSRWERERIARMLARWPAFGAVSKTEAGRP